MRPLSRLLPCALCLAAGFALAAAVRPPKLVRAEILPGETIVVQRPTGEVITCADGSGGEHWPTEKIVLKVFRSGAALAERAKPGPVWTLTVGGVPHAAERVE